MRAKISSSAETVSRNPEQTRQRILEAALKEFALNGFAGARVDAIAARARINKRMLYHYFGNKEDLFRAVLRNKISERSAWMAGAPANPFQALPQWFELMRQDTEWIRLLQWEALHWKNGKVIDESQRKEAFARGIELIREQQKTGAIPADLDAGQLILSLLALTAYPFAFPHLARMATGLKVSDPEFAAQRTEFLQRFAAHVVASSASTTGGSAR